MKQEGKGILLENIKMCCFTPFSIKDVCRFGLNSINNLVCHQSTPLQPKACIRKLQRRYGPCLSGIIVLLCAVRGLFMSITICGAKWINFDCGTGLPNPPASARAYLSKRGSLNLKATQITDELVTKIHSLSAC